MSFQAVQSRFQPAFDVPQPVSPPLDDAQRLVILLTRILQNSGVQLNVRQDMREWSEALQRMEGNDGPNPTFDPEQTDDLNPSTAFWIELADGVGRPIACIAHRLFETPRFPRLMETMAMWYPKVAHLHEQELILPHDMPLIGGKVGHGGGLVVDMKHRGRGFSWILPRVGRALATRLFGIDWYTSIEMAHIHDRGYCPVYGNAHTVLAVDGFFRPRQREARAHLSYMSRAEMLAQQTVDVGMLVDHNCHDLRDLRAITGERQREAPVVVQAVA